MKRLLVILSFAVLVASLSTSTGWAQATAQISGRVSDQTGAVLPGVEVTATQTDTGIARTTITNETGSYVLANLPLGPYRLEASLPGFRTFVQSGIVLQVNAAQVINPVLEVGQVSEQIEVQANATQVETQSAGVGQVVEQQRILDLPLNGRQVTDLITLSGAAVQTGESRGFGMRTGVLIAVAGGNSDGVQYTLDGASHINPFDGTSMPLPFPDALQEFKLSTSTQDASHGGRSGAAVSSVTKSGTNEFHGNLFEFVRNNKFNANDPFAQADDGLKRNQFGGTIGGPIKRDKMFFFAGFQGTTVRQTPHNSTVFVPTPDMLVGDFTTFTSPACNNGRQINLRGGFVNNKINPAAISPAAVRIASYLPKPLDSCGRYLTGNINHENNQQLPVRVDYQVNDKQSLFVRYMLTNIDIKLPYDLNKSDILTANAIGSDDQANSLTIGHTYLISPNMVNSFRVMGNRVRAIKLGAEIFGPADVGIPTFSYTPKYFTARVSGAFNVGAGNFSANSFAYTTTFGANDDVNLVKGNHQIAFGMNYMRSIEWSVAQAWSGHPMFFFPARTGAGMSDFMVGFVALMRQANPNPLNLNQNFWGAYAQDTWKINPKLTLTYGVRWEPFFAMVFPHGDLYNFDLNRFYSGQHSTVIPNAPPGFTYPGDPGFAGKSGIKSRYGNFDPRVGLAWDVRGDGRTAVRIGGGVAHSFIEQDLHLNTSSVSPFRLTVIQNGVSLDNPWANYPGGNPFPYNYDKNNPQFAPYGSYLPVPNDMNTQIQYSWNVGIQHQATQDLFVSATYLGSHMIHIWNATELNPALYLGTGPCTLETPDGPVSYPVCSTSSNVDQRRILNLINPQASLSYITQYDDGGTQGYNGMLLDMRWRHGQNLNINTNYTWSHCIGLETIRLLNPGANHVHQPYQNNGPDDRNLDVADCSGDRRHLFNLSMVARTPSMTGSAMSRILSNWAFSPILQIRSGEPLNIVIGSDVALNGMGGNSGTERPQQVLASLYDDTSSLNNYLNRDALVAPAEGTYGNLGYNAVRGPSFWNWNMAISREFQFRESQRVEFRAEAFNVTNSFRRGNPSTSWGSANTFGRILSAAGDPRILQFALKYFF